MEKRKTITVKLDVYEDKVKEFRALLHLLKISLNESGYEKVKRNYYDSTFFDTYVKEYFDFIKNFVDMIFISSIDGENPVPNIAIMSVPYYNSDAVIPEFESDWTNQEESSGTDLDICESDKESQSLGINSDPLFIQINEFIAGSKEVNKLLDKKKLLGLAHFIIHYAKNIKRKTFQIDEFWKAAASYRLGKGIKIPQDLYELITTKKMYGYRMDVHTVLGKKSKQDDYLLVHRIHELLIFNFPEMAASPHQVNVFTGYICHFLGVFDNKGKFEEDSGGGKSWREYLAVNVKNHLKTFDNQ